MVDIITTPTEQELNLSGIFSFSVFRFIFWLWKLFSCFHVMWLSVLAGLSNKKHFCFKFHRASCSILIFLRRFQQYFWKAFTLCNPVTPRPCHIYWQSLCLILALLLMNNKVLTEFFLIASILIAQRLQLNVYLYMLNVTLNKYHVYINGLMTVVVI